MSPTPKRTTPSTGTTGKPRRGVVKDQPTDSQIEERRMRVAGLLLTRRTQSQIAQVLGVHRSTVNSDVKAIRLEWQQVRMETFESHLEEELARLAMLESTLMPGALGTYTGQPDPRIIDRILRIIEQRARWLGFDKPQRVEITGANGGPVEIEQVDRAGLLDEIDRLSERLAATTRDASTVE